MITFVPAAGGAGQRPSCPQNVWRSAGAGATVAGAHTRWTPPWAVHAHSPHTLHLSARDPRFLCSGHRQHITPATRLTCVRRQQQLAGGGGWGGARSAALSAHTGPGLLASPMRSPRKVTLAGAPRSAEGCVAPLSTIASLCGLSACRCADRVRPFWGACSIMVRRREAQGGASGKAGARSLSAILSRPARCVAAFPSRRRCLPRPHRWRSLHRRMPRRRRCPMRRAGRARRLFVGCGAAPA